jgi:REP element-mobilizing transposase RayT
LGLPFLSLSENRSCPADQKRTYGQGHWHFITFSCYQCRPLLKTAHARDVFVRELARTRDGLGFDRLGYIITPEHAHLLISEPPAQPKRNPKTQVRKTIEPGAP